MSRSGNLELEVQFALRSASSSVVWATCRRLLQESGLLETEYLVWSENRKRSVEKVDARIGKEPHSLSVHGDRIRLDMGGGGFFISVLHVVTPDGGVLDWDKWNAALAKAGEFVAARLISGDYERWQNQTNPDLFRIHGRSTTGLKLSKDPDLGELVIDISSNPGRRVGRKGYSEALGATMWLSPELVNMVGTDQRALQTLGVEITDHKSWLKLRLSAEPFDDDNPVTEELRKAVFPRVIAAV